MRLIVLFIVFLIYQASNGLPHESKSSDHDESDMWMEADELPPPEYSVVRSESRVVRHYSTSPNQEKKPSIDTSVTRVEHFEPQVVISSSSSDPQNPTGAEQTLFPSFFGSVPSLRPYQISTTLAASIANRYNPVGRGNLFDQSILGSGDFTVMRGGTFYSDEDDGKKYQAKSDEYFEPYNDGKPIAEALTGKKELYYPEDPFENFKDFADMTAGSDPAFSHFVVIYANKNSTKPHPSHPSPKNIFEQLEMIDKEKEESDEKISDKKLMKLSKYKTKLAKTKKIVKKYKKKLGPKVDLPDYTDPLLATS